MMMKYRYFTLFNIVLLEGAINIKYLKIKILT